MLKESDKALIRKLELPYPAVAIRFRFEPPDAAHYEGEALAFCQYLKYTQDSGNHFYIDVHDDACYGKVALGMVDKPPVTAFGQAGYDEFCPAVNCDFDPELLLFVADLPQADILMRATSYISGDLWESRSSPVLSCAWMYAYPIISGKVNHITTGFYHGLKRRKAYPPGLRMIAVPFQKMPEFFQALGEMDWTLIAFREDEGSRAELARRMAHWQEMAAADGSTVDLR